ncbi:hypothetical protein HYX08_01425 [Candidatus Woesearchaeota archaeon]|nr:hypothetical protein [Candidatus Woesearchaeota archaeon]
MANPKAQSWSIDVALAVIIFMAAFFIFYGVLNANPEAKAGTLKEEASSLVRQVASGESNIRIVDNNQINISKFNELKNLSYDDLKSALKISGDFCIYLEDEKGNLVLINNSYKGIGSPNINLSGTPCSQK